MHRGRSQHQQCRKLVERIPRRGMLKLLPLAFVMATAQWLPDTSHRSVEEQMTPTYAGEVCAFYDVRRVFLPDAPRKIPRLGALTARQPHESNASICDGYGVRGRNVVVPCSRECPAEGCDHRETWPVLLCAPQLLTPFEQPAASVADDAVANVLLVSSDHNNHGLFAQVERVLNQLHLAEKLGLTPFVFLGRKVVAPPWSCAVGENQYFDGGHGTNVWEYYFEPVSKVVLGQSKLHGRPVRLLTTAAEDARKYAIRVSRDAVTSYFEFNRYDETLHEIRTRVRRMGAKLVHRWLRVRPPILREVHAKLAAWRSRAPQLLGVHLRGTDKVTHPKVPLEKFMRYIDAFVAAHAGALIVLATDDARYHKQLTARYGDKVVSAFTGYATANVVRDPSIARFDKGRSGLVDALLLAHTDFLLKGTSSLAEFALWYSPGLIDRHLDLQITGEGERSPAYTRLIPKWAGGPYEPPPLAQAERADAKLEALRRAAASADDAEGTAPTGQRARGRRREKMGEDGRRRRGEKRARRHGGGRELQRRGEVAAAGAARVDTVGARGYQAAASDEGLLPQRERDYWRQRTLAGQHPVPEWPLPPTFRLGMGPVPAVNAVPVKAAPGAPAAGAPSSPLDVVEITSGTCATRGLRPLAEAACEEVGRASGNTYIGKTVERAEFAGCMRWAGGFVEFNSHPDASISCAVGGKAPGKLPACFCEAGLSK